MLRLAGVALSVGLADSLNPSTVGPALYLATGRRRVLRVLLFTAGVLAVDLAAGIALTMGPGRLLLGLMPHPRSTVRHALELAAGVALIAVAAGLWLARRRLARRTLPAGGGRAGSGFLAGASIAAVELPTAAPYLAVIVAVAASSATRRRRSGSLALYCVAFVRRSWRSSACCSRRARAPIRSSTRRGGGCSGAGPWCCRRCSCSRAAR